MQYVPLVVAILAIGSFSAVAQERRVIDPKERQPVIDLKEFQPFIAERRNDVIQGDRQATEEDLKVVHSDLYAAFNLSFDAEKSKIETCLGEIIVLMEEAGVGLISALPRHDQEWIARVRGLGDAFGGTSASNSETVVFSTIPVLMVIEGLDSEIAQSHPASLEFAGVKPLIFQTYASGMGASWARLSNMTCSDRSLGTEMRRFLAEKEAFVDFVLHELEGAIALMYPDYRFPVQIERPISAGIVCNSETYLDRECLERETSSIADGDVFACGESIYVRPYRGLDRSFCAVIDRRNCEDLHYHADPPRGRESFPLCTRVLNEERAVAVNLLPVVAARHALSAYPGIWADVGPMSREEMIASAGDKLSEVFFLEREITMTLEGYPPERCAQFDPETWGGMAHAMSRMTESDISGQSPSEKEDLENFCEMARYCVLGAAAEERRQLWQAFQRMTMDNLCRARENDPQMSQENLSLARTMVSFREFQSTPHDIEHTLANFFVFYRTANGIAMRELVASKTVDESEAEEKIHQAFLDNHATLLVMLARLYLDQRSDGGAEEFARNES